MQKAILISVILIELFAPSFVQAQGTLYISNLDQTPTGSAAIGSDSWIAQRFFTGGNSGGYVLNSVQLLIGAASGNPSGFNVSIYNSSGGVPQNDIGTLSGPDPLASGTFTYTAPSITLSASTYYFVTVTSETPVLQGSYNWSAANSFTSDNAWEIDDVYFSSPDGSTWTGYGRQNVFQMAIYATAIPEPATLTLAGLGLAALSFRRRRQ